MPFFYFFNALTARYYLFKKISLVKGNVISVAIALSVSLLNFSPSHATELIKVEPEIVGELILLGGITPPIYQPIVNSATCRAAGGVWAGQSLRCRDSDDQARRHDFTEFHLSEPTSRVLAIYSELYPFCSPPTVSFSGWGIRPEDPGNIEYTYGVRSFEAGEYYVSGMWKHVCSDPNQNLQHLQSTIGAGRNLDVTCPAGSEPQDLGEGEFCYQECPAGSIVVDGQCVAGTNNPTNSSDTLPKDSPCTNYSVNSADPPLSVNPCDYRTGAKYRHETDFSSSHFTFTRHYHSQNLIDVGFGVGWHHAFLKRLVISVDSIAVFEGNGRGEPWKKVDGVWQGDADSDYLLTETSAGFTVTLKRGDVHEYNLAGLLLSETDTQGKVTTYGYDAQDRLTTVTHYYGQSITFEYSTDGKNHITSVTDTSGVEYGYEYDANDNLIAVIYPDLTSDTSDNPRRIYHYEDARFPNNITGITNVDGDRYATFSYSADGRAIESALAPTTNSVGQERVQLEYTGHGSNNSSGSN